MERQERQERQEWLAQLAHKELQALLFLDFLIRDHKDKTEPMERVVKVVLAAAAAEDKAVRYVTTDLEMVVLAAAAAVKGVKVEQEVTAAAEALVCIFVSMALTENLLIVLANQVQVDKVA
jgi:hypothetical protein